MAGSKEEVSKLSPGNRWAGQEGRNGQRSSASDRWDRLGEAA